MKNAVILICSVLFCSFLFLTLSLSPPSQAGQTFQSLFDAQECVVDVSHPRTPIDTEKIISAGIAIEDAYHTGKMSKAEREQRLIEIQETYPQDKNAQLLVASLLRSASDTIKSTVPLKQRINLEVRARAKDFYASLFSVHQSGHYEAPRGLANRRHRASGLAVTGLVATILGISPYLFPPSPTKNIHSYNVTALTYDAPPVDHTPLHVKPAKVPGGGGGGGDHDKLPAPKGKLPPRSNEQITPPAIVVRNEHPKLAVVPTVVIPPNVRIADNHMPNLGVPTQTIPTLVPSNGPGAQSGIGTGNEGGVGEGGGPGVGKGHGGGYGGGPLKAGDSAATEPELITGENPKYSDEAKTAIAKGGIVYFHILVAADGHVQDVEIVGRRLGMGLDEQAVKAIKGWTFKPAMMGSEAVSKYTYFKIDFGIKQNKGG